MLLSSRKICRRQILARKKKVRVSERFFRDRIFSVRDTMSAAVVACSSRETFNITFRFCGILNAGSATAV